MCDCHEFSARLDDGLTTLRRRSELEIVPKNNGSFNTTRAPAREVAQSERKAEYCDEKSNLFRTHKHREKIFQSFAHKITIQAVLSYWPPSTTRLRTSLSMGDVDFSEKKDL